MYTKKVTDGNCYFLPKIALYPPYFDRNCSTASKGLETICDVIKTAIQHYRASFVVTFFFNASYFWSFSHISWSSFSGLMADQTGNYAYSFYMTGATLLTAYLIPMILIYINCKKSRVHPQNVEETLPGRSTDEL